MEKQFKIPSIFKSLRCFNGRNGRITQLRSLCPLPYEETRVPDLLEVEAVKALRSNRLFFEPDYTRSIMEIRPNKAEFEALTMESDHPYEDFRVSMEEIAEKCGLMGDHWKQSEELLVWYLKMNTKKNYGLIVEAFVDVFSKRYLSSSARNFQYDNTIL